MEKSRKSRIFILGLILLSLSSIALFYYYKIQTSWVESPPYLRDEAEPARTLVVVYSRTGNTFGAAREIARHFNAEMLQVKAPQYANTIKGQLRASEDADNEVTTTPIQHDAVDLSRYDLIILCSPTWWFRPAPPLWAFVENHDFSGKPVFLVMTGNSRYKERLTDKFAAGVRSKNGNFLGMLFIRRGRIFWHRQVREALEDRYSLWRFLQTPD
jgi:flavodoxin